MHDSGASRRGVANVWVEFNVIASAAKQSISPRKERMDCFAALAMTVSNQRRPRLLLPSPWRFSRCLRNLLTFFPPPQNAPGD